MQSSLTSDATAHPDARIVGDTLVASLPDAINPVVWRLPLGQVKASAIEVREAGRNFALVLKGQDGQAQDIAVYAAKADAVRALGVMGRAMFGATAATSADPVRVDAPRPPRRRWGWIAAAIALLAVLYLLMHGPRRVEENGALPAAGSGQPAGGPAPGAITPGVPQSADSFLQQQGQ